MSPEVESTSASLLHRIHELDGGAWSRFVRLYTPLIYRWCRQSGLQEQDIYDVAQEVFRGVARSLSGYINGDRKSHFRSWLRGVTRNKINDHFRRQDRIPQPVDGLSDTIVTAPSAEQQDSENDDTTDAWIVHRALQLLRPEFEGRTWDVFWRTTVGNERAVDIAAELGMTTKAARQAKYRVLRRLRTELEGQLDFS